MIARSDPSLLRLEFPRVAPDVESIPAVRVYLDSSGGAWRLTYAPVDSGTLTELRLLDTEGEINLELEPLPQEDLRAEEMRWLLGHQAELAELYPGEWVAVDGSTLLAHAPDLATLLKIAKRKRRPHPFISAIPAKPVRSLHVW